jgi:hypothetical protein
MRSGKCTCGSRGPLLRYGCLPLLLPLPGGGAYRERYCLGGRPKWRLNACENAKGEL